MEWHDPPRWRDVLENPVLDNFVVQFVELFNARDWEAISELFAPDAVSGLFDGRSREEVISSMIDLVSRVPTLLLTRGDVGSEPIAAAWLIDEMGNYEQAGYFTFGLTDDHEEPLLESVDYVEEVPDPEGVVLELPDRADREEWISYLPLDLDDVQASA